VKQLTLALALAFAVIGAAIDVSTPSNPQISKGKRN
jgi:hypothetical protein